MKPFVFADYPASIGRYGISIPDKARQFLDSRQTSLFLLQRLDWVEDAVRLVIFQLLEGDGNVSEYFRLKYSDVLPSAARRNDTEGERRPLLYRLRYLLRCLSLAQEHWREFQQWHFTGLEGTLDIFVDVIEQVLGAENCIHLRASVDRFRGLWRAMNPAIASADDLRRETQFMLDDIDGVFEELRDAFRERERRDAAAAEDARDLSAAVAQLAASTALHRRSVVACENLARAVTSDEKGDRYSCEAGLAHIRGARRSQLLACMRYSHERMPVVRPDRGGGRRAEGPTLQKLARAVWRLHRSEYESLSRLAHDPGYKNADSLGSKLYKLALAHPEADHFAWLA